MIRILRMTSVRLALAVMASFVLAFALLGVGMYYAVSALLAHDAREVIGAEADGLFDLYQHAGRQALLDDIRQRVAASHDQDGVYALIGHGGDIDGGSYRHLPAFARPSGWIEFDEQTRDGRQWVIAHLQPLDDGEVLLAGLRMRSQASFLDSMSKAALVAALVAATLGGAIGWWIARSVSRRLRLLVMTASRVGGGELALRAGESGSGDAFDLLTQRFNAMLDRIEELLGGVRHATDHIAHDLRTPLTRLRTRLEQLREQSRDEAHASELDAAIAETDQLLQTFAALLRLARIEAQPLPTIEAAVDLSALIRDAHDLYTPLAAERGIALRAAVEEGGQVRGDPDQMFQMLVNLLDNAVHYAPAGTAVTMSLRVQPDGVVLDIVDSGPGIPESERERVFDRFYRQEAHRGSPGTGLGMSLVRAIVVRHGGRVWLEDNAPGLRVRIRLLRAGSGLDLLADGSTPQAVTGTRISRDPGQLA